MLRIEQVGGLAVAFAETDRRSIEQELKRLDPNLFLDFETNGRFVYPVVMEWIGEQHKPPAVPVLVWKDRDRPRPLTHAIVEHVKRREKRDDHLVRRITEANAAKEQAVARESDEQYDDIIRDWVRAGRNGGHFSGPIHRSLGLARTRARMRAKGKAR